MSISLSFVRAREDAICVVCRYSMRVELGFSPHTRSRNEPPQERNSHLRPLEPQQYVLLPPPNHACFLLWLLFFWRAQILTLTFSSPLHPTHTWSKPNTDQYIGSCGTGGSIALSHASGAILQTLSSGSSASVNTLCFSSGSRYLVSGGAGLDVDVWDLKVQAKIKSYDGHADAVTALLFSPSDKHVVSGDAAGTILVHSLVSGSLVSRLAAPGSQGVTALAFSPFKKSLLGAANEDGAVYLWNLNASGLHAAFEGAHESEATGFAFSPVNHLLATSVGLDKRIVFYDVFEKKIVKVITAPDPLTCIAFLRDGVTLLVGTSTGRVLVYNLKTRTSSPQLTIDAHPGSPVASLHIENTLASTTSTGPGPAAASSALRHKPSSASSVPSVSSHIRQHSNTPPRREHSPAVRTRPSIPSDDILSPLKGGSTSTTITAAAATTTTTTTGPTTRPLPTSRLAGSGTTTTTTTRATARPLPYTSPLRGETTSPPPSNEPLTPPRDRSRSRSSSYEPRFRSNESQAAAMHRETKAKVEAALYSYASPVNPPEAEPVHQYQSPSPSPTRTTTTRPTTRPTTRQSSAPPPTASSSSFPSSTSASSGSQGFESEFVKNMLDESLNNFRELIHKDIQNLHVDMLRQFQVQKSEIASLLEKYSARPSILEQVATLTPPPASSTRPPSTAVSSFFGLS